MTKVKNQYVGDVNDFYKYGLLRALAKDDERIGVFWMLTENDDGRDGNQVAYLENLSHGIHQDPELFQMMKELRAQSGPNRVDLIEAAQVIPGASYCASKILDDIDKRLAVFASAFKAFSDRSLIFFDPDNGLEVRSKKKGRKDSSKYLYRDEVKET